jgi:6-phosphogluconolactonase
MVSHAACASLLPGIEVVDDAHMAERVAQKLYELTADEPRLSIVFSGGQIAPRVLEIFVRNFLDGRGLTVIVADERITTNIGDTNARLLKAALVSGGATDTVRLVAPTQGVSLAESAEGFEAEVRNAPEVAAAVVGVGTDGHIASLFPSGAIHAVGVVDVVTNAPSPFSQRISLSMEFLRAIPLRMVALAGKEKAVVLDALAQGMPLPVARLDPTHTFVSEDAANAFATAGAKS